MQFNRLFSSLFVRDGGKSKPSKLLLSLVGALGVIVAIGLQFLSTVQTSRISSAVEAPKIDLSAQIKPPEITSAAEAERATERLALGKKMHSMTFQPLKAVSLQPKLEVPLGSEVSATLSSGGSNGTVTALLDASVESDGDVVLPKGTLLYGKGTSSDERLYVTFSSAVFPDKKRQKVRAAAFDQNDRMEGLKGKKISDYAFKFAASAGLFFLGGLADGMRDNQNTNPFVQQRTTARDAALNGVSTATLETGKNMLQKMNEEKSRIEVKATTKVLIIFGDPSESQ
jgi:hypothetical protein